MIAGDILSERARLTPERTALVLVADGRRFSYYQLDVRAGAMAAQFTAIGLAKGDRVAILAQNCVEYIDAFFATGRSGAVLVPLNYRLTAHELAQIVGDAEPKLLLFEPAYMETAATLQAECAVAELAELEKFAVPRNADYEARRCRAEDPWCLLYTSGTTGKPKGVIIPHRQVLANAHNTADGWKLSETDIAPIITPLCHAGGLGVFLTSIFLVGGTIVLHRGFDAAEIWRSLERERYTVLMGVPTIFKMLMESPGFESADLSTLRWIISGGAPLPSYIAEVYRKRGVVFKLGYGLTEVGVNCFQTSDEDSARKPGSIGRPIAETEAKLVDANGQPIEGEEVGELCLRGSHVCGGYWRNPEATTRALDSDGWWHTGDTAHRDAEGFYYIAGRAKDMFISGGVNVYPAEVEAELLMHPGVQDAAVLGIPDSKWGEVGVGFVVRRPDQSVSAGELTSFLAGRLARFKIPREFVFTSALPRTPYGKVMKRELEDQYSRLRGLKDSTAKSTSS